MFDVELTQKRSTINPTQNRRAVNTHTKNTKSCLRILRSIIRARFLLVPMWNDHFTYLSASQLNRQLQKLAPDAASVWHLPPNCWHSSSTQTVMDSSSTVWEWNFKPHQNHNNHCAVDSLHCIIIYYYLVRLHAIMLTSYTFTYKSDMRIIFTNV